MSTTLITTQAQLQAWTNSPSGTGQLQNDITINVQTWTIPSGSVTAGIVFDGNGKTITLSNTSGSNRTFAGLLRLNGGTVQNVKITSNSTDTNGQYVGVLNYSSYLLYESSSASLKTGTIDRVWIDACKANGMVNYGNSASAGFLCGTNCKFTITNCQVGRSKDNPAYNSSTTTSGGFMGIICGGNGQSPQISKSVLFFETYAAGNYSDIFYGACGSGAGFDGTTCTISECVFYWKNSISPTTSGSYGDQPTRGRNTCAIARGPNRITITNCYLFIDWNVTISVAKYSLAFGNSLAGDDTSNIANVSNMYCLINFVNGNSIVSGYEPVFWATSLAHTMTNIAIPPNTTYDISNGTRINCTNTYTTATLNTDATIAAFSNTVWNKAAQPPILSFNSTTPWDSTNAIYDSPNVLTAFYTGGGGGGGGGGVICYGRGTRILMADGTEKNVEDIRQGDLVHTHKHGPKEVTLAYNDVYYNDPKLWYRCMFENQESGLRITGSHRIAVRQLADWQMKTYDASGLPLQRLDDEFILLHSTVAVDKFKPVRSSNKFEIFHFALSDEPDEIFGVFANGILTESVPKKLIEEEVVRASQSDARTKEVVRASQSDARTQVLQQHTETFLGPQEELVVTSSN